MVRPLSTAPRLPSGAFGSKPPASASSLRKTIWANGRLIVVAIATSFCPRAVARPNELAEACANCELPEITELIAPMPVIDTVLTLMPCFCQSPRSLAT